MEAIEAGASDFIVKPFKSEDVLSVVRKVLATPSAVAPCPSTRQVPLPLRRRGGRAPGRLLEGARGPGEGGPGRLGETRPIVTGSSATPTA